jgi:hypothetical protein
MTSTPWYLCVYTENLLYIQRAKVLFYKQMSPTTHLWKRREGEPFTLLSIEYAVPNVHLSVSDLSCSRSQVVEMQ